LFRAGDDREASKFLNELDDDLFPDQPDKDFVDTVIWSPKWNMKGREDLVIILLKALCGGSNMDIDHTTKTKSDSALSSDAVTASGILAYAHQFSTLQIVLVAVGGFLAFM
jgi:hypothetical protein